LYTRMETGFLPEMDEGGYVLDYWTPPGTSLAETDRILRQIETRIQRMPETGSFSRRTGAELGLFVTEQNKGDFLVKMKPRSQRKRSTDEVIADLRSQIQQNVPGIQVEFIKILQDMIGDLEGSPEPVEIKLFGDSMPVLAQAAEEIGAKIQKIPGIVDYKGILKGNPEIIFHVDPALAGRLGLTVPSFAAGQRGASRLDANFLSRGRPHRGDPRALSRWLPDGLCQYPAVSHRYGQQTDRAAGKHRPSGRSAGRNSAEPREPATDGRADGSSGEPRPGQRHPGRAARDARSPATARLHLRDWRAVRKPAEFVPRPAPSALPRG